MVGIRALERSGTTLLESIRDGIGFTTPQDGTGRLQWVGA